MSAIISLNERMTGALWGALIGDALGVPVEFLSRKEISRNPVADMREYGTHRQPKGTWSDDSSMLLCTTESLAARGGLDTTDLGQRFVRWKRNAHWTPHGEVFDIGITTSRALTHIELEVPAEMAGGADVNSNGNGSLMRILPVALWFQHAPSDEIAKQAARVSSITHRHSRSQMACALYCLLVRQLLNGANRTEALKNAMKEFARIYSNSPSHNELTHFRPLESPDFGQTPEAQIESSGYVIDTLLASTWCLLNSENYEQCVLKAVNLGNDTDTTGTVAGGLAGAYYGMTAIPYLWGQQLARHDDVEALFESFLTRMPAV